MLARLFAFLAVAIALTVSSPAMAQATAAPKIAVVDFQAAMDQVKDGAVAKQKLDAAFRERKAQLDAMETKLRNMKDDYDKTASILADSARKQKENDMMQLQQAYQQAYMQSEQDMQTLHTTLTGGLIEKMTDICEAIGKEKGYTMILERNEGGVLYAQGAIDITPELVKRYDAAHGG